AALSRAQHRLGGAAALRLALSGLARGSADPPGSPGHPGGAWRGWLSRRWRRSGRDKLARASRWRAAMDARRGADALAAGSGRPALADADSSGADTPYDAHRAALLDRHLSGAVHRGGDVALRLARRRSPAGDDTARGRRGRVFSRQRGGRDCLRHTNHRDSRQLPGATVALAPGAESRAGAGAATGRAVPRLARDLPDRFPDDRRDQLYAGDGLPFLRANADHVVRLLPARLLRW